jgi:hypothetical protein
MKLVSSLKLISLIMLTGFSLFNHAAESQDGAAVRQNISAAKKKAAAKIKAVAQQAKKLGKTITVFIAKRVARKADKVKKGALIVAAKSKGGVMGLWFLAQAYPLHAAALVIGIPAALIYGIKWFNTPAHSMC